MARGDFPSSKQDQFVLRMPDGLRARIKAYAQDHGRSMNAEIVRILEREFPEPWPIESRVSDLLGQLRILKAGVTDVQIDRLTHEIEETVRGIFSGRVDGLSDEARSRMAELWQSYQEDLAKHALDYVDLDPEEEEQMYITGSTEKFVFNRKPSTETEE
jgi:plasmid stability protein